MTKWYIATAIWPNLSIADYIYWSLIGFLLVGIIAIMALTWPKPPKE